MRSSHIAGGVAGALIGAGGVWLVKELAVTEADGLFRLIFGGSLLPRSTELAVDLRVLATALGLATATAIVCGLLPALQLSRPNHLGAMGTRGPSTGRREPRTRSLLVIGQLVMATVLLVGAGLLAHSFVRLMRTDLGYTTRNILEFQLLLPDTYDVPKRAGYVTAMLERLRAIPGVDGRGLLATWRADHRRADDWHLCAAGPRSRGDAQGDARARPLGEPGLHHRARDADAARP